MRHWPGNSKTQKTSFGDLTRSELMSRIPSSGAKTTEERLMKLLKRNRVIGWRRKWPMPGKPDFAWPIIRVALFVDGCFWHGHNCSRNLKPRTNTTAWTNKIINNKKRDRKVNRQLRSMGWQVIRVWECELRQSPDLCLRRISKAVLSEDGKPLQGPPQSAVNSRKKNSAVFS